MTAPLLPPDSRARCRDCGYLLRGLSDPRCPECGRGFDPADPRTMDVGRVPGPLASFFLGLPGTIFEGAVVAVCGMALLGGTVPGGVFLLQIAALWLGVALTFAWGLRLATFVVVAWRYRRRLLREPVTWRHWGLTPLVGFLTALLLYFELPLRLTFLVSRPGMEQLVQEVAQSPEGTCLPGPLRIGVYRVENIEHIPGGARFTVGGGGFLDQHGYAWFPSPPPARSGADRYTPFWGRWYLWTGDW